MTRKEPSRQQVEQMISLYYSNPSLKDVAAIVLGDAKQTEIVKESLIRFNVVIRRSKVIPGWHSVDWSKSSDEIAAEMGVHPVTVSNRRRIYAPETIKKHVEEKRVCPGCRKTFRRFPKDRRKYCTHECSISSGKYGRATIERMVKMYEQGYGVKHIAEIVIGRRSAHATVLCALKREGIETRSCREGLKLSRHENALGGKYTKERKRLKKKHQYMLSNKAELPLFAYGSERAEKERKRNYNANAYSPQAARAYLEKRNEEARSKGYHSHYQMRYQTDREFRLHQIYRRRFKSVMQSDGGGSTRMKMLLGCSYQHLVKWIEALWEDWMTWENYGGEYGGVTAGRWQIDHVIPCSWFDQDDEDEMKICWNYMNLRPLCSVRNVSIGNSGKETIEYLESLPDNQMKAKLINRANQGIMPNSLIVS